MRYLCDVVTCHKEAYKIPGGGNYYLCMDHHDQLVPDILNFDGSLPFSQEYVRWCAEMSNLENLES